MGRSYEIIEGMLGGPKVVGGRIRSDLDLIRMVRKGLPTGVIRHLVGQHWFQSDEIYHLVITRRTLEHRVEKKQPLSSEQSDRLTRVVRITAKAIQAFGSAEKARDWLRRPTRPLNGETPLSLLDSDTGVKVVEDLIGRIEHGIAA